MTKHNGGAAFPYQETDAQGCPQIQHRGLTKWEYFYGLAMQGILANPVYAATSDEDRVRYAAHQADAMLAEVKRRESDDG